MKKYLLVLAAMSLNAFAASESLDVIEVRNHEEGQSLVDFIPSVTTIKGKELQKRRETSIGDTLKNEAGVNSTSFGPSSGRPIIRGLDGDRIRILQNSLGTLDASTTSADHAIPIDPLTVDQMEIVRGPMSLLYGSSAVGGVVNIVTNRIHSEFEKGFFSKALVQGETVNNGISSALHLNFGVNQWMIHADGSTRNLGDQRIPHYAHSSWLRKNAPSDDEKKNKLPNSFNKQDSVATGVSRVFDRGYLGLSFNHFNSLYGSVAEEEISIDMTQNRFELHGEWRPESGTWRKIKLRSAQSNYQHRELEGEESGTIFKNDGNETRVEGIMKKGNVEGVVGLQTQIFDFSAKGEEAFLPTSHNQKLALFTYQEYILNQNSFSLGGRVEDSRVEKKGPTPADRNFLGLNGSIGHQYKMNQESSLSTSLSYTERAPNFQELYSLGDHIASGTYEEGNATLKEEKAYALEMNLKVKNSKQSLNASVYTQIFKDYISLNPTGASGNSGEGFTEYKFAQVDAQFWGFDVDARQQLAQVSSGVLTGISKFDFVRAKDTDSGKNLPRISPPRVTIGLEHSMDKWTSDIELQYVAHQTKTAPSERKTDSYTLTNLGTSYNITSDRSVINVFGRVRNIFDVEARNHVSFLKEIAPLPGRNFIVGVEAQL